MNSKILGGAFIFSIFLYILLAYFLQGSIKPLIKFERDFKNYLYILSTFFFLISLSLARSNNFSKKIIAYAIAEIPVILALILFFLTSIIYPIYIISFVAILVILFIAFIKGEEIEN